MLLDPTYAHTAVDVSTKKKKKKKESQLINVSEEEQGSRKVSKAGSSNNLKLAFLHSPLVGGRSLVLFSVGGPVFSVGLCVCVDVGGRGGVPFSCYFFFTFGVGEESGGGGGRCFFSSSAWGWVGWSGGVGGVGRGPVISVLLWHSVTVLKRDERWWQDGRSVCHSRGGGKHPMPKGAT